MELTRWLRALLRWWYLVAAPVALALLLVLPPLLQNGPTPAAGYTTVVRFTASQSLEALPTREGDLQDVWFASELTVKALTSWALTSSFSGEVAERAAQQGVTVQGALPVAVDQERSVGQLFLSWPDAAQLEVITDAALDVLADSSGQYFPQLGDQPARVTILDTPTIVPAAPPLADRYTPLVRVGIAGIIGLALAVLAEYLDPTLRRREDAEALGWRVVASVPRYD